MVYFLWMDLSVGDIVKIACPYSWGGHNIEQLAEVRWRDAYSFGFRRTYGFRYFS